MSVASIVNFEYILHFTGYKLTYHDSGKTIVFIFHNAVFPIHTENHDTKLPRNKSETLSGCYHEKTISLCIHHFL